MTTLKAIESMKMERLIEYTNPTNFAKRRNKAMTFSRLPEIGIFPDNPESRPDCTQTRPKSNRKGQVQGKGFEPLDF